MADLPEWAMEKAGTIVKAHEDEHGYVFPELVAPIALALVEAERRGIERAAEVADRYPERDPAEDGSGYWAAEEIAAAIRKLGDER
mgnify:CR=1 FL=1